MAMTLSFLTGAGTDLPECDSGAPSGGAGDCRSRQPNTHSNELRELCYPWHPWFGRAVAVYEVLVKRGPLLMDLRDQQSYWSGHRRVRSTEALAMKFRPVPAGGILSDVVHEWERCRCPDWPCRQDLADTVCELERDRNTVREDASVVVQLRQSQNVLQHRVDGRVPVRHVDSKRVRHTAAHIGLQTRGPASRPQER